MSRKHQPVKKRHPIRNGILSILYIGIFIGVTSPLILFYGPYSTLKQLVVSTVMATRHQYLITTFLSQADIDALLGKKEQTVVASSTPENATKSPATSSTPTTDIEIKHKNSTEINQYKIEHDRYIAHILEIKDPTKIKAVMTKYVGKNGQKTSEMALDYDAIAAINGGAFADVSASGQKWAGNGAIPGGFVITNGAIVYPKENVNKYDVQNVVAFTKEGKLVVGDYCINDLMAMGVTEAMCFRPPSIIIDGVAQITDKLQDGTNPRTAIGQKADGTVVLLVIDGRTLSMPGATLYDVQQIFKDLNVVNAGNLDGGYSSTMYFNGEIINSPNAWSGERTVATAFIVER
ncbi:phosphodiester glycosidase family protein [Clostridium cellulovorans]|uniref:Phosphodiester glycosidase domain-containing protein n=1 Tax=Clostridium cellulovorans (strain ATCC 35296 / DSM 3052 / OCM 3 / 743B) TaxID=573061 RepID=D9SVB9_CLOC7|nr:phosphodiester glycosidase family protein [Clostridium cellulovorans]ADL51043.1 hypothetical protein Clocel_1289 [Clostridium cellulovorans 743B]